MKRLPVLLAIMMFAGVAANATNRYVGMLGFNTQTAPFTNWLTAASNIQIALNASVAGDVIYVTNGTYFSTGQVGGYASIYISKAITLKSINGPDYTILDGNYPEQTNKVMLVEANGANIEGFTIRNGTNRGAAAWGYPGGFGSGILVGKDGADVRAVIKNCTIVSNWGGSGQYALYYYARSGGTVQNCRATCNLGYGMGMCGTTTLVENCTVEENRDGGFYCNSALTTVRRSAIRRNLGPGIHTLGSTFDNCAIVSNQCGGAYIGSGAAGVVLRSCLIAANERNIEKAAGGVSCWLYNPPMGTVVVENCTITRNLSTNGYTGGIQSQIVPYQSNWCVRNCIIYDNAYTVSQIPANNSCAATVVTYSCTYPMPVGGSGNVTNNPSFTSPGSGYGTNAVLGDYHLLSSSPCINKGTNVLEWMLTATDLDGLSRLSQDTVDMGCYERHIPKGSIYMVR